MNAEDWPWGQVFQTERFYRPRGVTQWLSFFASKRGKKKKANLRQKKKKKRKAERKNVIEVTYKFKPAGNAVRTGSRAVWDTNNKNQWTVSSKCHHWNRPGPLYQS